MKLRRRRRGIIRRGARRTARRVSRRTVHRITLTEEDVTRIEQEIGQPVEELTEKQLLAAMNKLGIKKLELNDQ